MLETIDAVRIVLKSRGIIQDGNSPDQNSLDWRSVHGVTKDSRYSDLISVLTLDQSTLIDLLIPILETELDEKSRDQDILFKMILCNPNYFIGSLKGIVQKLINEASKTNADVDNAINTLNLCADMTNVFKVVVHGTWPVIDRILNTAKLNTKTSNKADFEKEILKKRDKLRTSIIETWADILCDVCDYHHILVNNDGPVQRVQLMRILKMHPLLKFNATEPSVDIRRGKLEKDPARTKKERQDLLREGLENWNANHHTGVSWATIKNGHIDDYDEDATISDSVVGIFSSTDKFEYVSFNLETYKNLFPIITDAPEGLFKLHSQVDDRQSTISALRAYSVFFFYYHQWCDYTKSIVENIQRNPDHHLHGIELQDIEILDPMILSQLVFDKYSYDLTWNGRSFTTVSQVTMKNIDSVISDLILGLNADASKPVEVLPDGFLNFQELFCSIRNVGRSGPLNALIARLCFRDYATLGVEAQNHSVTIEGIDHKRIVHVRSMGDNKYALLQMGYEHYDNIYHTGVSGIVNKFTVDKFGVFLSAPESSGSRDLLRSTDYVFTDTKFITLMYYNMQEEGWRKNEILKAFSSLQPHTWLAPASQVSKLVEIQEGQKLVTDSQIKNLMGYGLTYTAEDIQEIEKFAKRLALSRLLAVFQSMTNETNSIVDKETVLKHRRKYLTGERKMFQGQEDIDQTVEQYLEKTKKKTAQMINHHLIEDYNDPKINLTKISTNYMLAQNLVKLFSLSEEKSTDDDSSILENFIGQKNLLVQQVMKGDFDNALSTLTYMVDTFKSGAMLINRVPEIILPVTGLLDDFNSDNLTLTYSTSQS